MSLTQLGTAAFDRSAGAVLEADERISGAPLSRLAANSSKRGLSAFGNSETEFDLKGLFEKFSAQAGLDSASGESATAEFILLGDGKELWRSGEMEKTDAPKSVEVDIFRNSEIDLAHHERRRRPAKSRASGLGRNRKFPNPPRIRTVLIYPVAVEKIRSCSLTKPSPAGGELPTPLFG